MARLLTIVNERKRLRNEYRKHLEDEYIAGKKAEEAAQRREAAVKAGEKPPPTPEELKVMLNQRFEKKQKTIEKKMEEMKDKVQKGDTAISPLLNDDDLKLISTVQTKLSQQDILKMYVKNWGELDLRQRRKVMAHIQAQRAMHAKEVFLKELAAIGRKFNSQPQAKVEKSRIKNKKDPLKLRLEGITAVEAA
jgi:hypothetical protein